jgi:hypothetical protein
MNINNIYAVFNKTRMILNDVTLVAVKWCGRVISFRPTQMQALIGIITVTAFAEMAFYYKWSRKANNEEKPLDNNKKEKTSRIESNTLRKSTQELNESQNKSESSVEKRTIANIVNSTQNGEEVADEDVRIIYEYLNNTDPLSVDLEIYYELPINVLKKINVLELTSPEHLYWLCFGRSEARHEFMHNALIACQLYKSVVSTYQSRFEALVGTEGATLQFYCHKPCLTPYFSAAQLKTIRLDRLFENIRNEVLTNKLELFFPIYTNMPQMINSEQERFAALFDAKDIQYMFEEGSLNYFSKKSCDCDYYMSLISIEHFKKLNFSLKKENKRFRIHPLQIITMFVRNGKVRLFAQELTLLQKEQIQESLEVIRIRSTHSQWSNDLLTPFWSDFCQVVCELFTKEESKNVIEYGYRNPESKKNFPLGA